MNSIPPLITRPPRPKALLPWRQWATAATTALFVVVAVTGVLLFFHVGKSLTALHEWLGLAFAAAALLHVIRNWGALRSLATKPQAQAVMSTVAIIAIAFAVISSSSAPDGKGRMLKAVANAPVSAVAPVLGLESQDLTARLAAKGITGVSPEKSLAQIARDSGQPLGKLVNLALDP